MHSYRSVFKAAIVLQEMYIKLTFLSGFNEQYRTILFIADMYFEINEA